MMSVAVLLAAVSLLAAEASAQGCATPRGEEGRCIGIKQCPPLLEMLQQYRTNPGVAAYLQASQCGFANGVPMVCCPQDGGGDPVPSSEAPAPLPDALPKPNECGYNPINHVRVIGGKDAKLGAWPWIAVLGYRLAKNNGQISYLCGAALINRQYLISAAHCIRNDLVTARVADLDLNNATDGAAAQERGIAATIVHPDYKLEKHVADIAIIKLDRPVDYVEGLLYPICLPVRSPIRGRNYENNYPFVAGWGAISVRGPSASKLQQLQVPVRPHGECRDAYARFESATIDDRVLCAGFQAGGKDACQGDSGGPLMFPENKVYYLIGVVSYGYGCAQAGYPGVYTRVDQFIDWIVDNIK